jgi:hypothetical protein
MKITKSNEVLVETTHTYVESYAIADVMSVTGLDRAGIESAALGDQCPRYQYPVTIREALDHGCTGQVVRKGRIIQ